MTRRLRLVPVMIVMLAMWPVTSDAQNIPVKWGAGASSLAGVDFLLPLEIDMSARADLVGSFSLVARWDTTKIRLMGGDAGDFGEITVNDDSLIAGVLLASGANPAGIGGKFSVLSARFRPLVDDTTTITLDVTELFAAGTFDDLTSLVVSSDKAYCAALGRYGDLDGDGSANSRDALIALSSVVGLDVPFNPSLGDVDGDGQTEAMDALVILSNAVGLNVSAFRVFVIAPGACVSTQIQPGFAVIPGDQELLEGQVLDLRAQGTDANGDLVTLTDVFWRTSDDQIVTVTPNGEAVGLSAGVATITAIRAGTTDSTNITLTVLASRTTHWVDRAAFLNPNQIGSAILPFGSINDAIDTANEGDTVRVLPGRYDEQVSVGKSIIVIGEPVVTPSNGVDRVTGIGTYPVIVASGEFDTGVFVWENVNFELHNFKLDTLYIPIYLSAGLDILINNVEIRSPESFAGVYASNAINSLTITDSRFLGSGAFSFWGVGVHVYDAQNVTITNSTFAEHGGDAIELYGVVNATLTGNSIGGNGGYGLRACPACSGASPISLTLSSNTFDRNLSGQVFVDEFQTAAFANNVIIGTSGGSGYYQALDLYGVSDMTGTVTMSGDQIEAINGDWIQLMYFDTFHADGISVRQIGDDGDFYDGNTVTILNSVFFDLDRGALDWFEYDGSVEFGSLILDNVQFLGPTDRTCDRCADAVETSMVNTTANNVTGTNLDYVFYSNYGSLTVTSSTFTDTYSGIMTYCGSVTVDNLSSTNSQYHVESDGCFGGSGGAVGPQLAFADDYPDVLTVTNSAFSTGYQGIDSYQMTAVVANNTLRNVDYPIDHYAGPITIADNVMTDPKGTAIDFDLVFDSLLAEVQRNTITCDPLIAYSVWAIRGFDGEMNIADNVVTNCYQGIDASSGFLAVPLPLRIANNTVTIPSGGRGGIEADGASARVAIVGNAVSGPGYWGSIYAGSHISTPYAVVDSNVITGSLAAGIWSRDVDSLFIRDNSVTDNGGAGCCFSPGSAILVSTGNATALAHQVLRNSVVNSATHGITIAVGFSDTVTTLVDSNTVKGSGQYGIWVSTGAAIIRKNAVDSTGSDGVRVSTTDSVLVNQNNITRSTGYGVNNTSGILLNATSNWWGDALGPGGSLGDISSSGDSVSANVTFSPFLTAINGGVPLPAAFWAPIAFTSAVPAGHDIPPRYERRERLFETDVIESEEITVPDRNRLFTDLTESVRDLDERTAARRLAALETRQARRQAQAIRNQERVDRRNARIAELEARRAARRADGGAQ